MDIPSYLAWSFGVSGSPLSGLAAGRGRFFIAQALRLRMEPIPLMVRVPDLDMGAPPVVELYTFILS